MAGRDAVVLLPVLVDRLEIAVGEGRRDDLALGCADRGRFHPAIHEHSRRELPPGEPEHARVPEPSLQRPHQAPMIQRAEVVFEIQAHDLIVPIGYLPPDIVCHLPRPPPGSEV